MCGIFAYSGPKKTDQVLIQGLKHLEYRGYDSAGIAFFEHNKINRFRVCGGVEKLEKQSQAQIAKEGWGWDTPAGLLMENLQKSMLTLIKEALFM